MARKRAQVCGALACSNRAAKAKAPEVMRIVSKACAPIR